MAQLERFRSGQFQEASCQTALYHREPGSELYGLHVGCYKIKLRQQSVRLVYYVEDSHLMVTVVAADNREDSVVYEFAIARLSAAAAALTKALPDKLKKQPGR